MASSLDTLNNQANGTRLSKLLVDKGTEALRAAFDFYHPPATLAASLNKNKAKLQTIRYRVIYPSQWKLLYPSSGSPDSQNFDVTLLNILLRNICGLAPPTTGWDDMPPDSDSSVQANITRIKIYRNEVHAHITTTEVSDNEFENLWQKIRKALIGLGIPTRQLDDLKIAPLCPEEANSRQQLKDWYKQDIELIKLSQQHIQISQETNNTVKKILHGLVQNSRENTVVDTLCKCEFKGILKKHCKMFLPGTRQWLFDQLNTWFTDDNSDSTVMVVTAGPGVGKSVFAAEVCRMYDEKKTAGSSSFLQVQ